MQTTLRLVLRPAPRHVSADKSAAPPRGGALFDRWFESWAARADARWRNAGDPHQGRYY